MATEQVTMTPAERAEYEAFLAQKKAKEEKEQRKQDRASYKELSADFVKQNINFLTMHHEATEVVIDNLFKEYESILGLKTQIYGTRVEEQDSHTSTLEDGSASITIGWNASIGFDGTESEGVKKIKDFIATLSDDSENVKKLSKMVNTFLKPNAKTRELNPSKIIELNNLRDEFKSADFDEGLDIIFNAQIKRRNSMYVSGWKYVKEDGKPPRKIEFRFAV